MPDRTAIQSGVRLTVIAMLVNLALAIVKVAAGVLGNSYVLIADGIESTADIFSSLIVLGGLRVSVKPADDNHPFGHGKAESISAAVVSVVLLAAAVLIAVQSIREIRTPHRSPAAFTLVVLVLVVVAKEVLARRVSRAGQVSGSTALQTDAWHHRSDALTSAAAFVGILIALIGGPGYESADDWAALAACAVIGWNGLRLLRTALDEIMDAAASPETVRHIRELAAGVPGVRAIDKCRIRKSGLHHVLDIHVVVDGAMTVHEGHAIAHAVKDRLVADGPRVGDVTVHIEPFREDHRAHVAPASPSPARPDSATDQP